MNSHQNGEFLLSEQLDPRKLNHNCRKSRLGILSQEALPQSNQSSPIATWESHLNKRAPSTRRFKARHNCIVRRMLRKNLPPGAGS